MSDSFEDPRHYRSLENPCSWCGARWTGINGGTTQMIHADDCEYHNRSDS